MVGSKILLGGAKLLSKYYSVEHSKIHRFHNIALQARAIQCCLSKSPQAKHTVQSNLLTDTQSKTKFQPPLATCLVANVKSVCTCPSLDTKGAESVFKCFEKLR